MTIVLSVEDHPDNQELVRWLFDERDEELVTVATAEAALDLLRSEKTPIDVVLMDINLPGMQGDAAVVELRRDARFVTLPIIALTAHALSSDIDRIKGCGVNAVLSKPIDEDELFTVMERLLAEA